MSVFKATPIPASFKGAAPMSALSSSPETGPYRLRIFLVEDGKPSESGSLSHKLTHQVIDAPWTPGMVGKKLTDFIEPFQAGKTPKKLGGIDDFEDFVEAKTKAFMISLGFNAEKITALAKDQVFAEHIYCKKDSDGNYTVPRECSVFYEAYPGKAFVRADGRKPSSYVTYLDETAYTAVAARTEQIKLRNIAAGGGGAGAGVAVGTGTSAATLDLDDPLDAEPGAGGGAPSGGSASAGAAAGIDDLLE